MDTIFGLPAHILLVHAVVVLVPLAAISLLLCLFWPAARRRLVWPTLALAVISAVLTPITTDAGEWLERRVAETPLVQAHTELGDGLLPWTIGLAVVSAAMAFLHVRASRTESSAARTGAGSAEATGQTGGSNPTATAARPAVSPVLRIAVLVMGVVVAVGSCVQVYRIGESGSKAVWTGNFDTTTSGRTGGDEG